MTSNSHDSLHDTTKYGELVVVGSENVRFPIELRHRRFSLHQMSMPSAFKPGKTQIYKNSAVKPARSRQSVVVSMELAEARVVILYDKDDNKDMFQIGRDGSSRNQIHVEIPTVSRFACRIVIDREPPHKAAIFAGAFNKHNQIFLGQNATKAEINGEHDALTTNGILILHPPGGGVTSDTSEWNPTWHEVSVGGKLFRCNQARHRPDMQEDLEANETNELNDGTIIDVGGICLIWRSNEACMQVNTQVLRENIDFINQQHNQCPVNFETLIFDRSSLNDYHNSTPYAYKICGHVISGGVGRILDECPLCRSSEAGNIPVKLKVSEQPSIFIDKEIPTEFFKPCGHMASLKTIQYWSKIQMRSDGVHPAFVCPFCFELLDRNDPTGHLYLA